MTYICHKEGPTRSVGGTLMTYADALPNLFGFRCVCNKFKVEDLRFFWLIVFLKHQTKCIRNVL